MNGDIRLNIKTEEQGPIDRTRLASVSLHLSAVLFAVSAAVLAAAPFARDPATSTEYMLPSGALWLLAGLCIVLAIVARRLMHALRQRKRWAWIAAAVLFVLFLPTVFLPLGLVGLFGLMSKGTRAQFRAAPPER